MDMVWRWFETLPAVLILTMPKEIEQFERYATWRSKLDGKPRKAVDSYADRVAAGGSRKNVDNLKGGLFEIKIEGHGLRIYFAHDRQTMFLLNGGSKNTEAEQSRDIEKAREELEALWQEKGNLLLNF